MYILPSVIVESFVYKTYIKTINQYLDVDNEIKHAEIYIKKYEKQNNIVLLEIKDIQFNSSLIKKLCKVDIKNKHIKLKDFKKIFSESTLFEKEDKQILLNIVIMFVHYVIEKLNNLFYENLNSRLEEDHAKLLNEKLLLETDNAKLTDKHSRLDELHAKLTDKHSRLEELHAKLLNEKLLLETDNAKLINEHSKLEESFAKLINEKLLLETHNAKLVNEHSRLDEIEGLNENNSESSNNSDDDNPGIAISTEDNINDDTPSTKKNIKNKNNKNSNLKDKKISSKKKDIIKYNNMTTYYLLRTLAHVSYDDDGSYAYSWKLTDKLSKDSIRKDGMTFSNFKDYSKYYKNCGEMLEHNYLWDRDITMTKKQSNTFEQMLGLFNNLMSDEKITKMLEILLKE
jgi:hypothetical protein